MTWFFKWLSRLPDPAILAIFVLVFALVILVSYMVNKKCPVCGKRFIHPETYEGEDAFYCCSCHTVFTSKGVVLKRTSKVVSIDDYKATG